MPAPLPLATRLQLMDRVEELHQLAPRDRAKLVEALLTEYQEQGQPVDRALVETAVDEWLKPQAGSAASGSRPSTGKDLLRGAGWVLGTVVAVLLLFRLVLPLLERLLMWL